MELPRLSTQVMQLKVPELQECCAGICLPRTGRKPELQARLLGYLGEGGPNPAQQPAADAGKVQVAAAIITHVYCRAKGLPEPANGARIGPGAGTAGAGPSSAAAPPAPATPARVRCICQSPVQRGRMVQCQSLHCRVLQHADCMRVPPAGPAPADYHCELCRARLADPFWAPVEEQLLPPARVQPAPGRPPVQDHYGNYYPALAAERSLYLSDPQLAATRGDAPTERIQVGCLQLDDEVPLRYHWPRHAELRWNSLPYRRLHARRPEAPLGVNQRDEAASVAAMCVRGRNSVTLVGADTGAFVLLLQRCRRRSMAEVRVLMAPAETLAAAAARVGRLVSGGGGGDDGVIVAHQVVSLKDPLTSQRMKEAARFSDASGLQAFDLESFLFLAERNRKWQDPTTLRNSSVARLQRDTYMQRVLDCLAQLPEVTEVEVDDQGRWRPDGSGAEVPWVDIAWEPEAARAALRAAGVGPAAPAAGGGHSPSLVVGDSSESDEEQELQKAATAVMGAATRLAGEKRRQPEEPEVISLLSSDEDEAPPARRPAQTNGPAAPAAPAAPNGVIRIQLPQRGGPPPQPHWPPAGPPPANPQHFINSQLPGSWPPTRPAALHQPRLPPTGVTAATSAAPPVWLSQSLAASAAARATPGSFAFPLPGALPNGPPPFPGAASAVRTMFNRATPAPAGGDGSQPRLSQQAQEALQHEQAMLLQHPELVDRVNVDDWTS